MGRADEQTVASASAPPPNNDLPELAVGRNAHLDRYVLGEELGRGGMGCVYRARDAALDRCVALKVLPPRKRNGPDAVVTLRREARAMARLQHPNVVEVFSVGVDAGVVFIAMELVDGCHLGQWLREADRAPPAILEVFCAAARGLIAAHDAGIVHRDFKPSNVLMGHDGRVKVGDFGLARCWVNRSGLDTLSQRSEGSGPSQRPLNVDDLTFTGSTVGTPTYMPPEQHRGEGADELSDQYAFCVALWVSLMGRSPFEGARGNEALLARKEEGAPRLSSSAAGTTRAIARAIERGLEPDRRDRWPTMASLLAVLEGSTRQRRWTPLAATGLIASVLPLAVWANDGPTASCPVEGLATTWAAQRDAVAENLLAASPDDGLSRRALAALDRYVLEWDAARDNACNRVVGPKRDGQLRCLGSAGAEFRAWASTLAASERVDIDRALATAAELHPASACTRDVQPALASTHPQVQMVAAMEKAGRYDGALREIKALLATPSLSPSARADATQLHGELQHKLGASADAVDTLTSAYFAASDLGRHPTAFDAATRIAFIHAEVLRNHALADQWLDHARATSKHMGDPPTALAKLENAAGTMADSRADYDQAIAAFGRAIALHETAGSGTLAIAIPHNNRASARAALGDLEGAADDSRFAAKAFEEVLGPAHPHTLAALGNLTANLHQAAKYEEELEVCAQLEARVIQRFGREHEDVAISLNQRGLALNRLGRTEEAKQAFESSVAVWASLGEEGPRAALSWVSLANHHLEASRPQDAEPLFARARETLERSLGAKHPITAQLLGNIARMRHLQGRYADAVALLDESVETLVGLVGDQHPMIASFVLYRAEAHAALEDFGAAEADFERALQIFATVGGAPHDAARCRFELAKLLRTQNIQRERQAELARDAAAAYEEQGLDDEAAAVRNWAGG